MRQNFRKYLHMQNAVLAVFVVIALSMTFNTVKVIQRNYSLQQQVDKLEDEVAILELENQNIAYNIEYYKSDSYLELEARRRFNKAGPGESVILLPKDGDPADTSTKKSKSSVIDESNFQQWMQFLSGNKS